MPKILVTSARPAELASWDMPSRSQRTLGPHEGREELILVGGVERIGPLKPVPFPCPYLLFGSSFPKLIKASNAKAARGPSQLDRNRARASLGQEDSESTTHPCPDACLLSSWVSLLLAIAQRPIFLFLVSRPWPSLCRWRWESSFSSVGLNQAPVECWAFPEGLVSPAAQCTLSRVGSERLPGAWPRLASNTRYALVYLLCWGSGPAAPCNGFSARIPWAQRPKSSLFGTLSWKPRSPWPVTGGNVSHR